MRPRVSQGLKAPLNVRLDIPYNGSQLMAVEWNQSMTTGVELVDNRNREFFQHVNNLREAIDQKKSRPEIGRILDSLGRFLMRHFAEEELCMEKHHCPAAEANKEAHEELLSKFDVFRERYSEHGSNPTMVDHYCDTLSRWLVKHVTEIDTQLRDCADRLDSPVLASSC